MFFKKEQLLDRKLSEIVDFALLRAHSGTPQIFS